MCVLNPGHLRHRRKLKPSMKVFIAVISLTLLLWIIRPEKTLQLWTQYLVPKNGPTIEQPKMPLPCSPAQIVREGQKVGVKGMKTVLLSAYREHRTFFREVRVFAVVLRSEEVGYHCHLCCRGQLHVSYAKSYIHNDHFGFAYGTADILCPIPSGCGIPSHIAVTSTANYFDDTAKKDFLKVQNQKEEYRDFPYNFTVCISTMYDFTNVLQLVQSLEMMKLLGVNKVAIYKTSNSPETQRVLDYYTKEGFIEVIPWSLSKFLTVSKWWQPQLGPGDLHYHGQIPALNDCVYRYMYQSRYMALHDIDELILPQLVHSWLELMPQLEDAHGPKQCYMFENYVFPNTHSTPNSRTLWKNVPGVNILSHLYHEPLTEDTHLSNFKIIVNPRLVFTTSVHGVLDSLTDCSWVDQNVARLYHTRIPEIPNLPPEELIYDGRLLSYNVNFVPAVNAVLKKTGFLQLSSLFVPTEHV